ncbi:Mitochondrial ubiquitin ligase activator of NFKB 1 [Orchesella cincta]|uniref:RING-type E3 ubiquitin transferase n=1 Tax=Orchesella cincta TaxID=48709 RepID=A0A1D2N1M1_ORCCI|nr:Mitochondrial ubiquitin ligase activator of NFKB 1 [Orchesella cincta]
MMWTSFHDYVLLGVDSLLVSVLYAVYRRRDQVIKNIAEAPSIAIGSELQSLFEERGELHSSGTENVLPYVVLRGRVKELSQTIESSSGLKGVLQVVTLNEHSFRRHAFNHWGDNVRTIHQAHNSVPFALTNIYDVDNKRTLVEVENPFDANAENLLLTVSTNFTPSNSSVASTVMGFFTGVAVRGVEKTEEFLPVDTIVTGIGRLVKDSKGRVKIVEPSGDEPRPYILSTLPVESIIKRMESRNTMYKVATFVLFSVGVIVAVRRFHEWWRLRQLAKMRENILKQRSKIDLEGLTTCQTCTVCLVNPREVILLNCGHEAPAIEVGSDLTSLLNANPNLSIPYAAIRGHVTEVEEAIESSTGMKGVLQIVTLHEITAKRFGDVWDTDNIRPVHETRNSVPFALSSPSNKALGSSQISVQVEKPFESIWESLLLPSASAFTPTSSDVALLGGIGSGKVLGVRKTEKFLPLGSIVTGLGQIVTDAEGNIRLQQRLDGDDSSYPYILTTLSIEDLVRKLEARKNFQRILIGTTIFVGLVLLSRRLLRWRQNYKMRKLRQTILNERRNLNLDNLCTCQTCLVCLVNPREVILLNCGHVCVCADCALKVNGCCPICRERILTTRKAYIA